jgi:hypothetical protein
MCVDEICYKYTPLYINTKRVGCTVGERTPLPLLPPPPPALRRRRLVPPPPDALLKFLQTPLNKTQASQVAS